RDLGRRTGLLRCYLSRVESGHTVPSLETLAKIAEAMDISLAEFFPGAETPRDRDTQKMLGELSEDEIRFLSEIKRHSSGLSEGDRKSTRLNSSHVAISYAGFGLKTESFERDPR